MATQEDDPLGDLVELTRRIRTAYPPGIGDRSYGVVQGYISTISALHAYNYLEILQRLKEPDEDLAQRVVEMLGTAVHALRGMHKEVETLGSAPQGLALIIQRNINYIEGRIRDLADSCPEDYGADEANDGQDQPNP